MGEGGERDHEEDREAHASPGQGSRTHRPAQCRTGSAQQPCTHLLLRLGPLPHSPRDPADRRRWDLPRPLRRGPGDHAGPYGKAGIDSATAASTW